MRALGTLARLLHYESHLVCKTEFMPNISDSFGPLRVLALRTAYAARRCSPLEVVDAVFDRISVIDRPEIWTLILSVETVRDQARVLEQALAEEGDAVFERLPLFGVPFAVKDNIDVASLPTTAACEPFSYTPDATAFAVQRLLDAGAMLVGKTNLDQFATGLVGTRSPFGAVRQVEFPERVSGGSSSGSAVSVAAGCVAFSLGTDTAGSGRVPAGFNGLVGLKPSLGLVSKSGVVPACRSLDTLSIFAHDVADAWHVLAQVAKFDARDAYSRKVPSLGAISSASHLRIGVPEELEFFNDTNAQQAFGASLDRLSADLGTTPHAIDFAPFKRVSALLYDGPWVAERRAALGTFFDTNFADIETTVAAVIGKADRFSAVDAFNGQYALAELKREAERCFDAIDVLIVPTTPTHPLIADVQANPIERNSELGYYTNFVNLLDLCALSVPCVRRSDGLPAGVTLIAPSGADHRLATLGARIQALFNDTTRPNLQPLPFHEPTVALAVVGAHLRGQPLNRQLLEAGARFVEATTTSAAYRLYALANTSPPKPGLVRNADRGGRAIAVEVWDVPLRTFGKFVMDVPSPMGIGTVELADGRFVKGFICEPWAVSAESGAQEITAFGGWIAYLDSLKN